MLRSMYSDREHSQLSDAFFPLRLPSSPHLLESVVCRDDNAAGWATNDMIQRTMKPLTVSLTYWKQSIVLGGNTRCHFMDRQSNKQVWQK